MSDSVFVGSCYSSIKIPAEHVCWTLLLISKYGELLGIVNSVYVTNNNRLKVRKKTCYVKPNSVNDIFFRYTFAAK
jgi:hypothetical protein